MPSKATGLVAWITHIFGVKGTRFNMFKTDEQNLGYFIFFFFLLFPFVLNVGQYSNIIDVEGEKKEEQMPTPYPKMLAYSYLLWTTASGLWFLNLGLS